MRAEVLGRDISGQNGSRDYSGRWNLSGHRGSRNLYPEIISTVPASGHSYHDGNYCDYYGCNPSEQKPPGESPDAATTSPFARTGWLGRSGGVVGVGLGGGLGGVGRREDAPLASCRVLPAAPPALAASSLS